MPDSILFAPSTLGFYLRDVHGNNIPSDAFSVDYQYYRGLMNASSGKVISYDSVQNLPVLVDVQQDSTIPVMVSRRQAMRAISAAGLLQAVNNAVNAAQDEAIRIDWECAAFFKRDDPTLLTLAGALNLSENQLDELFIAASQY